MTTLLADVLNLETVASAATKTELFLAIWNASEKVEFDEEWKNGTGYLDFACDLSLGEGATGAFTDDYNRKGILLSAKGKSVVVFERLRNGNEGVLVSNTPRGGLWYEFEPLTNSCSSLDHEALKLVCQRVLDISNDTVSA